MPKIRFKLAEFERGLVFQVLYMDERFRSNRKENMVYKPIKNLEVISCGGPDISGIGSGIIFVRGPEKKKDLRITIATFESNSKRDVAKTLIIEGLRQWAENWIGWYEPSPLLADCSGYEF
jgi:hypothetical protein